MNKNFDYLGNTFQIQLLNQLIVDKEFSTSIMDVIESAYFDNKYFKNHLADDKGVSWEISVYP